MNQPIASPMAMGAAEPVAEPASTDGVGDADTHAPAVLYSFRRCPFAIRARLALAAAGLRPGQDLQLREVALKAKPPELLASTTKATVPVLVLGAAARKGRLTPGQPGDPAADRGAGISEAHGHVSCLETGIRQRPADTPGPVLDESLAIMRWALKQGDPHGWSQGWSPLQQARIEALLTENDTPFKHHLDRFKYAGRHGATGLDEREEHRRRGLEILRRWSRELKTGGWLLGCRPCLADMALLPFVRQFRLADPRSFDAEAGLEPLQSWLQRFLESRALAAVMAPPWAPRSAWRSPGRLYHLALRQDWQTARTQQDYRISTRGRSLQEVGFVHLSQAHQVDATARRFYGDVPDGELLLLHIDPERLRASGLDVRLEPAPGSGELFPHLHGALPVPAVLLAEPLRRVQTP